MQALATRLARVDLVGPITQTLWGHRLLAALVALYALGGWLIVASLGQTDHFTLFHYNGVFPLVTALCLGSFALGYPVYVMLFVRPKRLVAYLAQQTTQVWLVPERVIGGTVVFLLLPIVISVYSSLKMLIPVLQPFSWDVTFMAWDRVLHGGVDPWRLLHPLLGYPLVTSVVNFFYNLWFFIVYGVLFWQAFSLGDRRLRLQFLLSFVLLWIIAGNVLATLWSSAGPVYFGRVTGLADPYQPLMSYLTAVDERFPVWALAVQDQLWQAYSSADSMLGGGISAMPSLHVATVVLFALLGWRVHRWLGVIFTLYVVIILLGSVHLAWHYAVDGYVSVVVTCLIWYGVGWGLSKTR